MRRFVLGTNRTTVEQDKAFVEILRARWPHLGWWHQLSETWLFIDLSETITAEDLRVAANEAFPGVYNMVVESTARYVGREAWAGFGRVTDFKWMTEQWDKD